MNNESRFQDGFLMHTTILSLFPAPPIVMRLAICTDAAAAAPTSEVTMWGPYDRTEDKRSDCDLFNEICFLEIVYCIEFMAVVVGRVQRGVWSRRKADDS